MKKIIQENPKLQLLLLSAVIIQILTCVTAIGFYHPDQHFQIIEYSSFQLKNQSAATQVWELGAHIRPTLQVYLFSAYYLICKSLGIGDPYTQLTILRIFLGLTTLAIYNAMCIYYFKTFPRKILYIVLLILNFSWLLPYTRTLYSSEMLSSLFFFGAIFLYDVAKNKAGGIAVPLLTGFLFCLSFYFRFQMGFAIMGFVLWKLLFERSKDILPLVAGFLIGVLLNTSLDYWFYHEWVITPYSYYYENITKGKAAEMGTASFLIYIGVLVALVTTPPLSLILLYSGVKGSL
jgi:phosphatidylinositol glycan class B